MIKPEFRFALILAAFVVSSGEVRAEPQSLPESGFDANEIPEAPRIEPPIWHRGPQNLGASLPQMNLPISFSITVSGGVSLGAYQAGYLYYLVEVFKRNPKLFELRLITGASAGTINALMAVMSAGSSPNSSPVDSLFYKVWNSMHYEELLDVEKAPPLALSSRRALEDLVFAMENTWNKGLAQGFEVVVGMTATRLQSRKVSVLGDFEVPRQEEKFVFRVQGRGLGRAPRVMNYVDLNQGSSQPLLPFEVPSVPEEKKNHDNFGVLRQVMFASSAFPIAFSPEALGFCLTDPDRHRSAADLSEACPKPTHSAEFIDGGVFDRTPLRLAYRTAQFGLHLNAEGDLVWRDMPDVQADGGQKELFYLYLDPTHQSYPAEEEADEAERMLGLFPAFGLFMRNVVRSTQAKELYVLVEEDPFIREHMALSSVDFPTASGQMLNFFGFFERSFRRYDFYLGMRDARRFVDTVMSELLALNAPEGDHRIVVPEKDPDANAKEWKPYDCIRAVLDEREENPPSCRGESMRNFRVLLQTSLERVYESCRWYPYDEKLEHSHCKWAMDGLPPPRLAGVPHLSKEEWKKNIEENDIEYLLRLLVGHGFHFEDLGLDRDEADRVTSRLREEILKLGDDLAKKQPGGQRLALRLLGKPAINFFAYAPPEDILYLVFGRVQELGWSSAKISPINHWLRFNFALELRGMDTLLTEGVSTVVVAPLVGYEFEPIPLSGPLFQYRLGVRAGFQFSTGDNFLTGKCDVRAFENDDLRCSAMFLQAMLAVTFYERIRLQLGVDWLPRWIPPLDRIGADLWRGMIAVGWQWLSPL